MYKKKINLAENDEYRVLRNYITSTELTQKQMGEFYGCTDAAISLHILKAALNLCKEYHLTHIDRYGVRLRKIRKMGGDVKFVNRVYEYAMARTAGRLNGQASRSFRFAYKNAPGPRTPKHLKESKGDTQHHGEEQHQEVSGVNLSGERTSGNVSELQHR